MKTPLKVSMKVHKVAGTFFRMSIQNVNHLQVYFCEKRPSLVYFGGGVGVGARHHVCNTRTCTQKMPYFYIFLEKGRLSLSARGKNIMFSGKNAIFPNNTRKIMCRRSPFWKDHFFRKFEENIILPCIFLRKIIFHFPSKV